MIMAQVGDNLINSPVKRISKVLEHFIYSRRHWFLEVGEYW